MARLISYRLIAESAGKARFQNRAANSVGVIGSRRIDLISTS
jgi:hypothetical protein